MARSRKTASHAYRTGAAEDGSVTCGCGKEFADDDLWRAHYEESYSEAERLKIENRDPAADAAAEKAAAERHAAMVAARPRA